MTPNIKTGNIHILPRDTVLRCFSKKSMQLWPCGHELQGTRGLGVHGPEPRDPLPPPRSVAERVSHAHCAPPRATSQLSSSGFFLLSSFYESLPFFKMNCLTPTSAGQGMERKINVFVRFCKTLFWVWAGDLGKKPAGYQ